jgi:hypothetical protein
MLTGIQRRGCLRNKGYAMSRFKLSRELGDFCASNKKRDFGNLKQVFE